MEEPAVKSPTPGIHDPDLDLGYQLHHADAPHLGTHPFVDPLLTPRRKLAGRNQALEALPLVSGQVAGGSSTSLDANNSGGLKSEPITGDSAHPGIATGTGVGYQQSNSAGVDSDSAHERKQ